ncbi:hypothetical protein FQA39_LY06179 [Lamprigera yunnana]|nr:hypothetical protein FQA39_LY06179 [Lamprigera yunnana]
MGPTSAQLGKRNKNSTETISKYLEKKGALARRLKLDDALHLSQLVDMFSSAVLPYLRASQPAPLVHEEENSKVTLNAPSTGDEEAVENNADAKVNKTSKEENEIPANDAEAAAEEEEEIHANSEYDELIATVEEAEIPANDADAEVDVGRDEIITDEEIEQRSPRKNRGGDCRRRNPRQCCQCNQTERPRAVGPRRTRGAWQPPSPRRRQAETRKDLGIFNVDSVIDNYYFNYFLPNVQFKDKDV